MLNKRNSSRRTEIISQQGMVYMAALLKTVDGVDMRPNFDNFEESRKKQGDSRMKKFCSEMWGNIVSGRGRGTL